MCGRNSPGIRITKFLKGPFILVSFDAADGRSELLHGLITTYRHNVILSQSLLPDDFLEEHRRVLESRLQPVLREITDSRARTREELESLYRKIVSAVLLRSGLGSPTDIAVVREATGEFGCR